MVNTRLHSEKSPGAVMKASIRIGSCNVQSSQAKVKGKFVDIEGERYYCIENYDRMPPFFMSIVSNSDHWLFISSTGGLTAGRINAESALFPYETDDRITESYQNTGPLSVFMIAKENLTSLWEPFSNRYTGIYKIQRNIYKNIRGNKIIFEETNMDLGIMFRQSWRTSDRFGFVLTMSLYNESSSPTRVSLLSGVQNILPFGVTTLMQSTFSNLLNAYKRSELELHSGLGMFSLSSTLTDLAEPSESLKATCCWQAGLDQPVHLLSTQQVEKFRKDGKLSEEVDIRGLRGAYLVNTSIRLESEKSADWLFVLDVNQDSADIASLINRLKHPAEEVKAEIEADISLGSKALNTIIGSADGIQVSGDQLSSSHHYANVLFNTMRGGIFLDNYTIPKADFLDFLQIRNHSVLGQHRVFLEKMPEKITLSDLVKHTSESGDPNLERLCLGYLPLTFSRRHGDPSRPWNRFSINLKNEDGSQRLDYQGNWRDIFQNWEALACSYPEFIENMIATFVNAGTPDGYNPYRVTREGIEWEVPEPGNPWSNIGYWSDHQIIYLQKLLELSHRYHPGKLKNLLPRRIFTYVDVPYRLKPYADLVENPFNTIDFDFDTHHLIEKKVRTIGADGKLAAGPDGHIYHVTLAEKLFVLLAAKLVNFVPEGGIWMNTQRPEWNDANNALVGKGISVVTLGYLRRYVDFLQNLLEEVDDPTLEISKELSTLLTSIDSAFTQFSTNLKSSFSDKERRAMMDILGQAGSEYRWSIYDRGFSGEFISVSISKFKSFLENALRYIDHSLDKNRRPDGLYHAYNTLKLGQGKAELDYLYEMLEGQVSILSSGFLTPPECLKLLRELRQNDMYRADQHSYILYPDRELPGFINKNLLPASETEEIDLVQALLRKGDRSLIIQDENGDFHFNGMFRNANDVKQTLDNLSSREDYANLVSTDRAKILSLFEDTFDHDSFTGRSGTFFAYEGLGSIYWHMVSKLLLAAQENFLKAVEHKADSETTKGLADCYYDIRNGLGFNKPPDLYGAFPTDPYSHTPRGQGAKQPGMTGQVKEEILTRQAELGLFVEDGKICFRPVLLREVEFINQPGFFEYAAVDGGTHRLELPADSLAYTFCQTPIILQIGKIAGSEIHYSKDSMRKNAGLELDQKTSEHIFKRDGEIQKIVVFLKESETEFF